MSEGLLTLKRPEDYFTSPQASSVIEDVKKELQEGSGNLLDEAQLREQEDWSFLANRIVGAEGD
jgi:hypothetical protein